MGFSQFHVHVMLHLCICDLISSCITVYVQYMGTRDTVCVILDTLLASSSILQKDTRLVTEQ